MGGPVGQDQGHHRFTPTGTRPTNDHSGGFDQEEAGAVVSSFLLAVGVEADLARGMLEECTAQSQLLGAATKLNWLLAHSLNSQH